MIFSKDNLRSVSCLMCHSNKKQEIVKKNGFQFGVCLECGFFYMLEQPTEQAIAKFYNEDYWASYQEAIGLVDADERYDNDYYVAGQRWGYISRVFQKKLINCNTKDKPLKKLNILDIGCGTGAFLAFIKTKEETFLGSEYFYDQVNGSKDYWTKLNPIGVELNTMVAKEAAKRSGCDVYSIDLNHDCTSKNPFVDKFGVITMFDVLEHVPTPDSMLQGFHSLLTDPGLLVVEMPSRTTFKHINSGLDFKHIKTEHIWLFHVHELQWLLHRNGFTIVDTNFPVAGRMAVCAVKDKAHCKRDEAFK